MSGEYGAGEYGELDELLDGVADDDDECPESGPEEASAPSGAPSGGKRGRATGPGSRFVEVPAEAIRARMHEAGFTETSFCNEVVFVRTHARCKHSHVKVYTSMSVHAGGVRAVGTDAIRVVGVFERVTPGRTKPFVRVFYKGRRVHRTGTVEGVLERLIERAREAYGAINEGLRDPNTTCFECCGRDGRGATRRGSGSEHD